MNHECNGLCGPSTCLPGATSQWRKSQWVRCPVSVAVGMIDKTSLQKREGGQVQRLVSWLVTACLWLCLLTLKTSRSVQTSGVAASTATAEINTRLACSSNL